MAASAVPGRPQHEQAPRDGPPAGLSARNHSNGLALALACALGLLVALGGCSSVPLQGSTATGQAPVNGASGCYAPPPNTRAAYNRTYRVLGRSYTPLASASGYEAQGQASWYGWESGSTTSMGDRFNPRAFTAASRTLPLPTCVQVTNLANGRSALVLVNDRGPFVDSRIMDLSYGAAQALGITRTGTARVRIVALADHGPPAPAQGAPAAPVSPAAPPMDAAAQPETFAPAPIAVAQAGAVNAPGIESRPLPPLQDANSGSVTSPSETSADAPSAALAASAATPANATAGSSATSATATATAASTMAAAGRATRLASPPVSMSTSTPAPAPQTLAPPLPGVPQAYLQTGAFALRANAEAERAQLQAAGIGPVLVVPASQHGAVLYRVQIGPLPGQAPDTALLHKLRLLGLSAYAVVQQ